MNRQEFAPARFLFARLPNSATMNFYPCPPLFSMLAVPLLPPIGIPRCRHPDSRRCDRGHRAAQRHVPSRRRERNQALRQDCDARLSGRAHPRRRRSRRDGRHATTALSAVPKRSPRTAPPPSWPPPSPPVPTQSAEVQKDISRYIACSTRPRDSRAEVLGIHFEGPFISPVRRGVHPAELLKLPSAELLGRFVTAAGGHALLLTIAPELLGAMPCIDAARKAGHGRGHRSHRRHLRTSARGDRSTAHIMPCTSTTPCVRFPIAIRA